jgi:hypothetical protein
LSKLLSLLGSPGDLGLSRNGKDDSVQVDSIKNKQAWESLENIAESEHDGGVCFVGLVLLLIGFVAIWLLKSLFPKGAVVELEFDKVLETSSSSVCFTLSFA